MLLHELNMRNNGVREWATRNLHSGDLSALSAIAGGFKAEKARLQRLSRRGFVAERDNGRVTVTPRGRVALIVRHFIFR
jgi:hypothetical protein